MSMDMIEELIDDLVEVEEEQVALFVERAGGEVGVGSQSL
jgi:hypothetical protein